ncbi:nascent polypeptide-associated complex protein [Candidatus Pacearchaeota archaeon]|nr:nascent polypeptide-associated complex protein [Candidatus Pacearchaeota archaeon]
MFNLDPKKMQAVMRQMGIKQEEIDALRVVIETPGKNIVVEPASVQKIVMQGQESFQISGDVKEVLLADGDISEDDVKIVMEKTGRSEDESRKALEKTHDIAEAILELSD